MGNAAPVYELCLRVRAWPTGMHKIVVSQAGLFNFRADVLYDDFIFCGVAVLPLHVRFREPATSRRWEVAMKRNWTIALSLLCGAALGGVTVQTIHAQAKAPAYTVAEIDVKNPEGYKEYSAKVQPIIKAGGGRYMALAGAAAGGPKIVAIDGAPPKRVAIHRWDSMDKAMATFKSAEYREARKIGEKYATFRLFVVDGLPE